MSERLRIIFGDKNTCKHEPHKSAFDRWVSQYAASFSLNHLIILKQVHGIEGACVTVDNASNLYGKVGDFLITDERKVGIGVLTADCLPVVIYDEVQKVIAAVHAGWRGTVGGIIPHVIDILNQKYGSSPSQLKVFLGPAAQQCCYQVQADFLSMLSSQNQQFIKRRNGRLFFDNTACVLHQLMTAQVLEDNCDASQSSCTICNNSFYSYRRDQHNLLRQPTIAWIE